MAELLRASYTDAMNEAPSCPGCLALLEEVKRLHERIAVLEARLAQTSANSHRPPSADPPSAPPAPAKRPSGRKRGGQPGHRGHSRVRLPAPLVTHVIRLVPDRCDACGGALPAEARPGDPEPTWHQVFELPRRPAVVTEYQGHSRACPCCLAVTHHPIPAAIMADAFGPRLAAGLNALAACQHVSVRGLGEVAHALLGVPISLGGVARLQAEMGAALAAPAEALAREVADAPVKHADETGWGNAGARRWMWVALSATAVTFLIHGRRNREALKALLLGEPSGVVVSDRWGAYLGIPPERRQLCWAHLKRDFRGMAEAAGEAGRAGRNLVMLTGRLFSLLARVRDGTRTREWLRELAERTLRPLVRRWLEAGAACDHAATAGKCASILGLEGAMWTFLRVEGVGPTNNAAERALRPAVVRRKKSFGSASVGGEAWLCRILGVTQTLRMRGLTVLDYLADALRAFRSGLPVALVPQSA